MNEVIFEFAQCKCGYRTPIQPSTSAILNADQRSLRLRIDTAYVACAACRCIFEVDDGNLKSLSLREGLAPYSPSAPMQRFIVPIRCEELDCHTPIRVIAVRKSDTTEADVRAESEQWSGRRLRCPGGHVQDFPPTGM